MIHSIRSFRDRRGKRFWWLVRLLLIALITLAIFLLGWIGGSDYVTNIYTELIGVTLSTGVTVVIVDQFYERRDRERQTNELKERLVQEARSRSNPRAIAAIEQLREKGWLVGDKGLLKGAYLAGADLQNADLNKANLHGADLQNAKLQKVLMSAGNLQDANLRFVSLQRARLWEANLQDTKLWKADLQEAKLFKANLQNADLLGAYLQGATVRNANFSDATLPDSTYYTADTDLERFTNSDHPDFNPTLEKINEIRNAI